MTNSFLHFIHICFHIAKLVSKIFTLVIHGVIGRDDGTPEVKWPTKLAKLQLKNCVIVSDVHR
jgi:hypothetical protein